MKKLNRIITIILIISALMGLTLTTTSCQKDEQEFCWECQGTSISTTEIPGSSYEVDSVFYDTIWIVYPYDYMLTEVTLVNIVFTPGTTQTTTVMGDIVKTCGSTEQDIREAQEQASFTVGNTTTTVNCWKVN